MSNAPTDAARGTRSRPSRLWYLLPAVVFVAGLVGMGSFLFSRLSDLGENLVQVVVPGEMELTLDSGSYTIFHERRSTVDGRIFNVDNIADLGVTLASATGEPVALTPASASSKYEFAGRSGASAFGFEIEDPGNYLLSAAYRGGAAGPKTVLAVGMRFGGNLLLTLLGAFALAFGGAGLAVVIGWMVFVKRRHLPMNSTVS